VSKQCDFTDEDTDSKEAPETEGAGKAHLVAPCVLSPLSPTPALILCELTALDLHTEKYEEAKSRQLSPWGSW
jgi:hypothetical protein